MAENQKGARTYISIKLSEISVREDMPFADGPAYYQDRDRATRYAYEAGQRQTALYQETDIPGGRSLQAIKDAPDTLTQSELDVLLRWGVLYNDAKQHAANLADSLDGLTKAFQQADTASEQERLIREIITPLEKYVRFMARRRD